jgi:hypothetical protein
MEKEPYDPGPLYYSGGGQFYSSKLVRSLSETGQTSTSGPATGPSGGGGGGSGRSGASRSGLSPFGDIASPSDCPNGDCGSGQQNSIQINVSSNDFVKFFEDIGQFFENLFGLGGSTSIEIPRQMRHGRHPLYDWILGVSVGLTPTEASSGNPGRPLTNCEKCALAPYIPQVDLNSARIHTNGVPWYTPGRMGGITRSNDIYFRPNVYKPKTPEGLGLLGHELVHVGQYRNGMTAFSYLCAAALEGYSGNEYEAPAYALEAQISTDLSQKGIGSCCK